MDLPNCLLQIRLPKQTLIQDQVTSLELTISVLILIQQIIPCLHTHRVALAWLLFERVCRSDVLENKCVTTLVRLKSAFCILCALTGLNFGC